MERPGWVLGWGVGGRCFSVFDDVEGVGEGLRQYAWCRRLRWAQLALAIASDAELALASYAVPLETPSTSPQPSKPLLSLTPT